MSTPQVRPEEFVASLEQHIQEYLQSVMQAVNQAPDGEWIAGSEESVRDLSAKFRRQVFEKAIQVRIDPAEAAFPPPHHPQTGKRLAHKGRQDKSILTGNGKVTVTRRWWRATLTRSPRKRKAADKLLKYVSARQAMIGYPQFRRQGWQIGSGPTKAQCKLTVGRLKGRSRRWDRPNFSAIAALDSLERSGQWATYWLTPCRTVA